MKKLQILTVLIALIALVSCQPKQVKIACVGDSITEGVGTKVQSQSSYPVILNSLVDENSTVLNCGRSAATMMKEGNLPYWNCMEFYDIFAYQPDKIIIKLGTNDSKDYQWDAAKYEADYQAMIDTFNTIPTKPEIYVCIPVPAFEKRWEINDTTINEQVIPIIKKIAIKNNLKVIDLNTGFIGKGEYFPDGIHPNEEGAKMMAKMVADQMK